MTSRTRLGRFLERCRQRARRRAIRRFAARLGMPVDRTESAVMDFSRRHEQMFGELPHFDDLMGAMLRFRDATRPDTSDRVTQDLRDTIDGLIPTRPSSPARRTQATASSTPPSEVP